MLLRSVDKSGFYFQKMS